MRHALPSLVSKFINIQPVSTESKLCMPAVYPKSLVT